MFWLTRVPWPYAHDTSHVQTTSRDICLSLEMLALIDSSNLSGVNACAESEELRPPA